MATRQTICRIRVLNKNSPFLVNLSTCQNGLFRKCVGLARLANIRQAVSHRLAGLANIRRAVSRGLARLVDICRAVLRGLATCERRVWHVLCKFSESGESGEFGECRLDLFMHIKYVICA